MPKFNKDTEKKFENAKAMGQFRYDMVSPVINNLITDASAMDYYRRVCSSPLKRPDCRLANIKIKKPSKIFTLNNLTTFSILR